MSLPIGRPGSRFAFMDTNLGLRLVLDKVMVGIVCGGNDSVDDDAAMGVFVASNEEMISELRLSVWFVLTLYMPNPNLVRKSSALDFSRFASTAGCGGGDGDGDGGGSSLFWLAH